MRKQIKDIRREELLIAAQAAIGKFGLQSATIARIADKAGMSQGLVHHYFPNKSKLIEDTMWYTHLQFRNDVAKELKKVSSPEEKLATFIAVWLSEKWYKKGIGDIWINFMGEVPFNKQLAKIQYKIHLETYDNIVSFLNPILPSEEVKKVADCIVCLMDGLWVRRSFANKSFTRNDALKLMYDYVKKTTSMSIEFPLKGV